MEVIREHHIAATKGKRCQKDGVPQIDNGYQVPLGIWSIDSDLFIQVQVSQGLDKSFQISEITHHERSIKDPRIPVKVKIPKLPSFYILQD